MGSELAAATAIIFEKYNEDRLFSMALKPVHYARYVNVIFPMFSSRSESSGGGCRNGVIVKAMDCGIEVREFELQSRFYVHFRANTLGKSMNPLILPSRG